MRELPHTMRDIARELARKYSTMTHDELDILDLLWRVQIRLHEREGNFALSAFACIHAVRASAVNRPAVQRHFVQRNPDVFLRVVQDDCLEFDIFVEERIILSCQ